MGIILAGVGIASMASVVSFACLVGIVALGCLWEFARLAQRTTNGLSLPIATCATMAYLLLACWPALTQYESVVFVATAISALIATLWTFPAAYLGRSAATFLASVYIGKLLSYFILIRETVGNGLQLTFIAVVIIAFTDIFAMAIGMRWGKHPLSTLSPKKTLEGALGGLAVATVAATLFAASPLLLGWHWWYGTILGILTSLGAQTGDLVESAFKRDAHVKDTGAVLVGHGGFLDRFDSYIFGGAAFYAGLTIIARYAG